MDDSVKLCLVTVAGTMLICTKGMGHASHGDPRRQMHYDENFQVAWGPDATIESVRAVAHS